MKRNIITLIILLIVLGTILYILPMFAREKTPLPPKVKTTTTSTSNETNPDQEPREPKELTLTAKANIPAQGLGITIAPLEIIEDSRCPSDVVCIQAGTVRARVKITNPGGERALVLALGKPVSSAHETVELIQVLPEARSEVPIRTNEYRLVFKVTVF